MSLPYFISENSFTCDFSSGFCGLASEANNKYLESAVIPKADVHLGNFVKLIFFNNFFSQRTGKRYPMSICKKITNKRLPFIKLDCKLFNSLTIIIIKKKKNRS